MHFPRIKRLVFQSGNVPSAGLPTVGTRNRGDGDGLRGRPVDLSNARDANE